MTEEVSLSLDETNKVRISLGLKPIIPKKESSDAEKEAFDNRPSPKSASVSDSRAQASRFIQDDRIQKLRRKLTQLRGPNVALGKDRIEGIEEDWLEKIGTKSARKPVKITYEEEEEEMPLLKVSHDMPDFSGGKGIVLTLKENDIQVEEEDVLENENYVHNVEEAKRVELRQMNRDRKRMRKKLQISSADIDVDEEVENGAVLLIGAEMKPLGDAKPQEHLEDHSGQVKVAFESDGAEESDTGDYKPVTIKKRKRNANGRSKSERIELPSRKEPVKLVDEDGDADDLEEDFHVPPIKVSRPGPKSATPEAIASEIKREKLEREQRLASIAQMSNGLIIDEKTTFLDSLRSNLIEESELQESANEEVETNIPAPLPDSKPDSKPATEAVKEAQDVNRAPDFYDGLASTLNFLRDKSVLQGPTSAPSKTTTPTPFRHNQEVQEIRQQISGRADIEHTNYSPEELEAIKTYEDEQVARHVNRLQNRRLEDYNPDVKLVHKDEKGNHLTTKEAYKRLSQRFHGTKSNKKKTDKMQAKIEARKRGRQDPRVQDLL